MKEGPGYSCRGETSGCNKAPELDPEYGKAWFKEKMCMSAGKKGVHTRGLETLDPILELQFLCRNKGLA